MGSEVVVTRRTHFNAAHRLYNPAWSAEENVRVFGPCANPNGHGHNYNLDVSVAGEVDPDTGYVVDINVLKRVIEERVLSRLDHKNLNLDVPDFARTIPTAENIVRWCWRQLAPAIPRGRLARLVLWETERNVVEYAGG